MLDPSSAEHPKKRSSLDYIMTNMMERPASPTPRDRAARKLILCFDGTGNKFHGDESDSNILKIFRMLDRTADDQYHYYQRKCLTVAAGARALAQSRFHELMGLTNTHKQLVLAPMSCLARFHIRAQRRAFDHGTKRPRIQRLGLPSISMLWEATVSS